VVRYHHLAPPGEKYSIKGADIVPNLAREFSFADYKRMLNRVSFYLLDFTCIYLSGR
jgi:hypothetical protein